MLFVWPILFTSLVILYFTPTLVNVSLPYSLSFNYGFLIYAGFYVGLDAKSGFFAGFLCFLSWVFASLHLGFSLAWKVVLAAQLFCWTGQFIGHGLFEKRAPALLDNLAQAFLMAPRGTANGYEPYPGFHARVKAKVDANIKQWHDSKQKKTL